MNAAHKISKLRNRYNRLKRKSAEAGLDVKNVMEARMEVIEEILRQNKK
jgi:hypothetical protein